MKRISEFTILTNDPSMTAWGWAVIDKNKNILQTGCIKTETEGKKRRIRKSDETCKRISEIVHTLLEIINFYDIKIILTESPHGSQNASAAVMIGAVAAITQTISDCLHIPIEYYSEQDSKKALLNKKAATKQETINAISKLYDIKFTGIKYKDEAIADAISVFHCALKESQFLRMFIK